MKKDRRGFLVTAGATALFAACAKTFDNPPTEVAPTPGARELSAESTSLTPEQMNFRNAKLTYLAGRFAAGYSHDFGGKAPDPNLVAYAQRVYRDRVGWRVKQGDLMDWEELGAQACIIGRLTVLSYNIEYGSDDKLRFREPRSNKPSAPDEQNFEEARELLGFYTNSEYEKQHGGIAKLCHRGDKIDDSQVEELTKRSPDILEINQPCPLCYA